MCYSAQIYADWQTYTKRFGATLSLEDFYEIFWRRNEEREEDDDRARGSDGEQATDRPKWKITIPKALESAFANPSTERERDIRALIDAYTAGKATAVEQLLVAQRTRLADAEREIASREEAGKKVAKYLANDVRVATNKVTQYRRWLDDLRRSELKPEDSRIYPGSYCPVMAIENGELVVMPMRYHCRPNGKPANYDWQFEGCYNARRDNLQGQMWRNVFGRTHGVMIASKFFEHVSRHKYEQRELRPGEREEDLVLEFAPDGLDEMFVACIWSRWQAPGKPDLVSFAAVTDHPPAEVAAAGHDRCIIPLKPENIAAWLRPDPSKLAAQYAILDDRYRPYFEHRLAA
jgi:putative SOS response-associated peptidase YedK